MTIEQIKELKELGYSAEEIALFAPNLTTAGIAGNNAADAVPDNAPGIDPHNDAEQPAQPNNNDIMAALNKLTESIQANNRGQQGSSLSNDIETSSIFETIINGINKNRG